MGNLTLSIITVNFNNDAGLIKTLESIKEQTFTLYEHIIIDGGSTDGSLDTIRNYARTTTHLSYWVSEPDKGIYDGMNKGIQKAKGEYLYFLNSGDCLMNDILVRIPFDGTQYLYGDANLVYERQRIRVHTYPEIPDFIYLSDNSLQHQSCFIHHSLFIDNLYDIRYRIISDWAHTFQSLIMNRCSYRHLPYIISVCDACGISSNLEELRRERERWFVENLPPILSNAFRDCTALDRARFREVVRILSHTDKFKKRAKKLILFLYKISHFFGKE